MVGFELHPLPIFNPQSAVFLHINLDSSPLSHPPFIYYKYPDKLKYKLLTTENVIWTFRPLYFAALAIWSDLFVLGTCILRESQWNLGHVI